MNNYKTDLICDLAETYQIYDYERVPVLTLASLAAGLRPDSRVIQKLSGTTAGTDTIILADIYDAVNILIHMLAGEKKPPEMMAKQFYKEEKNTDTKHETFRTGADFEKRRKQLLEKIKNKDRET